jgi:hypothetical protein
MMDIMGYYVYSNYLKGCVFMNKIHFTKSSTKFSRTGKKATVLAATLAVMFACGGVSVQAQYGGGHGQQGPQNIDAQHLQAGSIGTDMIKANTSVSGLSVSGVAVSGLSVSGVSVSGVSVSGVSASGLSLSKTSVSDKVIAGSVDAAHVETGSVGADMVETNTLLAGNANIAGDVNAAHVETGSVGADMVETNTLLAGNANIAGDVNAAHVETGSVGADMVETNTLLAGNANIAGDVNAAHVETGSVGADMVETNTLLAGNANIAGDVNAAHVETGSVGADMVETNTLLAGNANIAGDVNAAHVETGSVGADMVETNTLLAGNANIAGDVNAAHVETGSVGADMVETNTLLAGNANIAGDVNAAHVETGSVGADMVDTNTLLAREANIGPVTISELGINAGKKKISDVADGSLGEHSKEAVNGSQLYSEQQAREAEDTNIKDNLIGKIDQNGNYIKTGTTVYANLTNLDNQVKTNTDAIGTTQDGRYVKNNQSVGTNLNALDSQVSANAVQIDKNTSSIATNTNAINNEVQNRKDADTTLQNNIDSEAATREAADNSLSKKISDIDSRNKKGIAGVAALAALHPLDFDPDAKWDFAAGYGNYRGENAAAIGAYYRPNEDVMLSVGGTLGNGNENSINAGLSFKLGAGSSHVNNSKTAMAKEIKDLRAIVEKQDAQMQKMAAMFNAFTGMNAMDVDQTKMFPDVPANHWAYQAVQAMANTGLIEGYPDGEFKGDRTLTRYEFAQVIYRALQKGAEVDARLMKEFAPELKYFHIDTIAKDKAGTPTIERVRVNK